MRSAYAGYFVRMDICSLCAAHAPDSEREFPFSHLHSPLPVVQTSPAPGMRRMRSSREAAGAKRSPQQPGPFPASIPNPTFRPGWATAGREGRRPNLPSQSHPGMSFSPSMHQAALPSFESGQSPDTSLRSQSSYASPVPACGTQARCQSRLCSSSQAR